VIRYFKNRAGFSGQIDHAELVNGQLDAVLKDGTRRPGWWNAYALDSYLAANWYEYFPAEYELCCSTSARAHNRLMEQCFTDTRSWRYMNLDKSWVLKYREQKINSGRKLAQHIAAYRRDPQLHTLRLIAESGVDLHKLKDTRLAALCRRYNTGEGNFDAEEWRDVPWGDETWYKDSPHYARQAHISVKNPALLAYTESLDKLERNIQTPIKPGRFLQKYFSDVLSEQDIREWVHQWERLTAPPAVRFIENTDPDGWVDIYNRDHGFDSCMTGEKCVQVYAHPANSLRLAYLTDPDDEERVVARAIVVERKRAYVRCYGDDRLISALESLGYSYQNAALEGETLCKIRDGGRDNYVMPYLDRECKKHTGSYSSCNVNDMGDHFLVTRRGDYNCGSTDGYITLGGVCPNCGAECREDDRYYSNWHNADFCESCSVDFVYAYINRHGDQDYVREYVEIDGEYWVDDHSVLCSANFALCEECSTWCAIDSLTLTSRGLVCECTPTVELAISDHDGNHFACEDDTKPAIEVATGRLIYLHEDTNYDEEYADPEVLGQLPLPTGEQTRPHDGHTHELFCAAA
jgi:hypothetical protein